MSSETIAWIVAVTGSIAVVTVSISSPFTFIRLEFAAFSCMFVVFLIGSC